MKGDLERTRIRAGARVVPSSEPKARPFAFAGWLKYPREDNDHGDTVEAWENFDPRSGAYLMFSDGGQQGDGTELFATLIDRCR